MRPEQLIRRIRYGSVDEARQAAEELVQLTRRDPGAVFLYRETLFELIRDCIDPGIQWHLAELTPMMPWDESQTAALVDWFSGWITTSPSSIVKADALAAICGLAHRHPDVMPIAKRYLARALKFGSPGEVARARRLIGRNDQVED